MQFEIKKHIENINNFFIGIKKIKEIYLASGKLWQYFNDGINKNCGNMWWQW